MTTPIQAVAYKPTFFDRHGPDGGNRLKAMAYGAMVLGLTVPMFGAAAGKMGLTDRLATFLFVAGGSLASAVAAYLAGLHFSNAIGNVVTTVTVSGASTPYVDQFSYQQSLVMAGKVDEAVASFETIITENPHRVDAHMRLGELYATEKKNSRRAAEVFRSAQAIPTISAGEDVYVTHRLVDLYTGPLGTPGRALIELRRLLDRYPGTPVASHSHARAALSKLKRDIHPAE
jgi:hypothetical protein